MSEPHPPSSPDTPRSALATLAAAALLLTFLQLLTAWFENIYRMSLIKLEMGPELAGLLLPLLALPAAWAMRRAPRLGARLAVLAYIAIYALVWYPPTTPAQTILLAGTGTALALAVAAHALAGPHGKMVDGFATAALATLAYATLRTAGHSLDIYAAGNPFGLLPALALLPLLFLQGERGTNADGAVFLPAFALFGVISTMYLVLTAPGLMGAWQGDSYTLAPVMLGLSAAVAALYGRDYRWCQTLGGRAIASTLFFVLLVAALLSVRVAFPAGSGAIAVAGYSPWLAGIFMSAAWCFAPGILLHVGPLLGMLTGQKPARTVLAFLAGLYFLVFTALLLVFTNVWGYVGPIGATLRNQFALPFVVCAIGLLAPVFLLRARVRAAVAWPGRGLRLAIGVWALLFVSADSYQGYRVGVPTPDPNTFTVLTYNYQQGSREDGDQAYAAQCAFIRRINPDIVALQESDTARPSGGFVNSPQYFADTLGYHLYYGPSTVAGTFGTAILSRFPMRSERAIYTYSDTDEVSTAAVDLKIGNKLVAFYNNHPAGSDTVMDAHADMLAKEIQRGGPVIAAGDFNSRPNEAPYIKINAILHNAWETLHPDNKGPGFSLEKMAPEGEIDMTRRIDHIFYSDDLEVISAHYVLPPESQTDHPAHWAKLKFKDH